MGYWSEKMGLPEYVHFLVELRFKTHSYGAEKEKVFGKSPFSFCMSIFTYQNVLNRFKSHTVLKTVHSSAQ